MDPKFGYCALKAPFWLMSSITETRIGREVARTCRCAGEDRRAACLHGLPVIVVPAEAVDRVRPEGIVFQTVRGADRRTEIKERIDVDLIEENADAAAHHEAAGRLVCKAEARREIVAVRR